MSTISLIDNLSNNTDVVRLDINKKLQTRTNKSKFEQYFSSASLSKFMASMMNYNNDEIKILDAGAGIGSLFVACVDEIINQRLKPKKISITAYEIDKYLFTNLNNSIEQCKILCEKNGIKFSGELIKKDLILDVVSNLENKNKKQFTHIIMNPPYQKINTFSNVYKVLDKANLPSLNLYTAFISLSQKILKPRGEMVFISPRSFCNGSYFESFRKSFFKSMSLKRIHVFDSRSSSFKDDNVLQENIIINAVKSKKPIDDVLISSNSSPDDQENLILKHTKMTNIIYPDEPQNIIHVVSDGMGTEISNKMRKLESTLDDLNIRISTGKVVDFRIKNSLKDKPNRHTVPLIHPFNLSDGIVEFPLLHKKKIYIENNKYSNNLLIKNGNYVLVKRFSTKEEKKRIVASVWLRKKMNFPIIGFENRVNYFYSKNNLAVNVAKGLSLFLNSSLVDLYFRQFNGNTQVNATDLRYIRYPTYEQLKTLGRTITKKYPEQKEIDDLIEDVLFNMNKKSKKIVPIAAQQKIKEAISILKQLGFPSQQQNTRSGLTLLALLDTKPDDSWDKCQNPMIGITPMMKYFKENYGTEYAPNSRETVRRQTVHQFLQAALIVENPDKPDRPTNSGKTVYRISEYALQLLQSFNSINWDDNLKQYKKTIPTLQKKYENERKMKEISLKLPSGEIFSLSAGGQNILVEKIINEFSPKFVPNGKVLYVGDTAKKNTYLDKDALEELGIKITDHGKIPDVIIHHTDKNWLLVIEAVTSHGPINSKRQIELKNIFSKSKIDVVYITAFLDKKTMLKYFSDISWETDVWIASSPTHMIHFDGLRFLGPYN